MSIDIKKMEKQSDFCLELMERLHAELKADTSEHSWHGVWWHTQKQNDIVRLRRELSKLNKMLYPYGE